MGQGCSSLKASCTEAADINNDGNVDSEDAKLLFEETKKMIANFQEQLNLNINSLIIFLNAVKILYADNQEIRDMIDRIFEVLNKYKAIQEIFKNSNLSTENIKVPKSKEDIPIFLTEIQKTNATIISTISSLKGLGVLPENIDINKFQSIDALITKLQILNAVVIAKSQRTLDAQQQAQAKAETQEIKSLELNFEVFADREHSVNSPRKEEQKTEFTASPKKVALT